MSGTGEFAKLYREHSELAKLFPSIQSFATWMGVHVEELPPAYSTKDIIALRESTILKRNPPQISTTTIFRIISEHITEHEIQLKHSPPMHLMLKANAAVDALKLLKKDFKKQEALYGNKSKLN